MKGINLMKTNIKIALFSFSLMFAVLSCDQPFRAGLGVVVDIRPPTVTLVSPGPGAFISGNQRFTGTAEDDYVLDKVEIRVVNFPDVGDFRQWTPVTLVKPVQNKGTWSVYIDTTVFSSTYGDGDLKIRLRASDNSGRDPTETEDILFSIRNDMPRIKLALPDILNPDEISKEPLPEGTGYINDDNIESTNLNYGVGNLIGGGDVMEGLPAPAMYRRSLSMGTFISGTIKYDEDIYTGPPTKEGGIERYPPQIRVWPISSDPDRAAGEYDLNEWPSYNSVPWETFTYRSGSDVDDRLFEIDVGKSYQFLWDAPEPGRFYGLEIRAQGKNLRDDGAAKFHYPRDFWPQVTEDGYDWDDPPGDRNGLFIKENRYVLFYVREQSTLPTAELYQLEDLLGDAPGNWNAGENKYHDIPGVTAPHPYVDRLTVNKNGPFTLRIKANHPDGIGSAEVYWQRDDGTHGRFIWDPATELTDPYNASTTRSYDEWGYIDPHDSSTSNFIFTYKHDGTDKIPNTTAFHELVRNRSKVQVYTGSDWDTGKRAGRWPLTPGAWEDIDKLEQGSYEIEVYVRKKEYRGEVPEAYMPTVNTIRLDWDAPEVDINSIDGIYSLDLSADTTATPPRYPVATANGVIRPRLRFSDSQLTDTGIRGASEGANYFWNSGISRLGSEQFYVLVGGNDRAAMDALITDTNGKIKLPPMNFTVTPTLPPATGATNVITGVTVYRHGPVFNSQFMIKTSKIYAAGTTENALANGDYWLYIFARDNAYNVGTLIDRDRYTKTGEIKLAPLKITVDSETDKPTIEFLGEIKGSVTDPNTSFDVYTTTEADKGGFWFGGATARNSIGSSSNIRLKLYDDDSLDLGLSGGAASKVSVTFTGSTDTNGVIAARTTAGYVMTLSDADIKDIFAPQPSGPVETGGRQAVRSRESKSGEISQSRLLALLKGNTNYSYLFAPKGGSSAYNSLPDGIYRIQFTIDDYAPAKLKLDGETATPQVASAVITFWIHVDTTDPVITVTDRGGGATDTNDYIKPAALGGSLTGDGIRILGTVSDINGPVKVKSFTVTGTKSWGASIDAKSSEVTINRTPYVADVTQYKADFNAPVHIATSVNDELKVVLQFEDRFGKLKSTEQRYKVDVQPPTVNMRKPIETFARQDDFRNSGSATNINFTRLANGIVSFNISASDNIKVKEVRWWLLPETVTDFLSAANNRWNYAQTNGGGRRFGSYTNDFTRTVYVDTTTLTDNTAYRLYVMAQDDATNFSVQSPPNPNGVGYLYEDYTLQRFYVLQKEDKPYFSKNSLSGVVGANDMIARITIVDDDGFSIPSGTDIVVRPGTVRVWMKRTSGPPASGFSPDSLGDTQTTDWTAPVTVASENVALQGSKTVSLNVDLAGLGFGSILTTPGAKYYVIEATDSWSGKFTSETITPPAVTPPMATAPNPTNGKNAYTVFWRELYSFDLDPDPPKITITAPAAGSTFAEASGSPAVTANNFTITGTISDANLKKYQNPTNSGDSRNDNYIIGIRLDTTTLFQTTTHPTIEPFMLGKVVGTSPTSYITAITPNSPATGETTVAFTIPMADFLAKIGYDTISHGNHTLVFMVEDQSGKTSSHSLNFVKDIHPPESAFIAIANTTTDSTTPTLPPELASNWWTTTNYEAKRSTKLPVIWYDNDTPSISGTFNDANSNIDKTSFRAWFDGETGEGTAIKGTNILTQLVGDGKYVRWTVYLTNGADTPNGRGTPTGTKLPDGVHSIRIAVKDAAGNELVDNKMYGFRINSNAPTSTVTGPTTDVYGDRTGIGNNTTILTVSGTGTSRNLDDVKLVIRYNGPTAVTKASHEWSVLKDLDSSNTANPKWTFVPATSTTPAPPPPFDLRETYNWTLNIPKSYILEATGLSSGTMRTGNYDIMVVAVDRNGKTSEETTGVNTYSFVVDSAAPQFNFTNLKFNSADTTVNNAATGTTGRRPTHWVEKNENTPPAYLYINDRNVLSSDTPSIRGRIWDTNNLGAVEVQLAKWNYANSSWQIYQFGGTAPNTWQAVTVNNSVNSEYWSALTLPLPASSEYNLEWAFTGVTPALLVDGYYSVRLRARDASTAGGAAAGWDSANSSGNPGSSAFAYFFIDRTSPSVTNADTATTFSSRYNTGYGVTFKVTASDANNFESMVVSVERINTPANEGTLPTAVPVSNPQQTGIAAWTASATLAFTPREVVGSTGNASSGLADGSYRVVFVATDLAGKTTREARTITLDNRAPTGKIEAPMFGGEVTRHNEEGETSPRTVIHRFASASDVKIGGDGFVVSGATDDIGDNGSASGPAGIWYRIGYGTQAKDSLPNVSGMSATARSLAIMAWATGTNNGSGVTITSTNGDTGAAFNKTFDDAAKGTDGSLWFKYEKTGVGVDEKYADGTTATNIYDSPSGFGGRTAIDLYKWALDANVGGAASVATSYAVGFETAQLMRTRRYVRTADGNGGTGAAYGTGANAQYLARSINEDELPLGMRRGGLYSLPLVIRVVDNAGNVFYELRDIWLYPNGDNPSSVIINPATRFTGYTGGDTARGGQMQVQGIASDNKSVRTVIYRVKVDGEQRTTAGSAPTNNNVLVKTGNNYPTNVTGGVVAIPSATMLDFTNPAVNTIDRLLLDKWNSYGTNGSNVREAGTGTTALGKNGWYRANLESQSYAPTMPWDFMLNTSLEINELIAAYGFIGSGSTVKNMIRVWVEVLVFDGSEPSASAAYNRMSLGDTDPNADTPRPYVREFYYTTSAPSVTAPQISNLGSTTAFSNYTSPLASNNVRSGNFALQATLNGNSNDIGQISVRLRGETDSNWRSVYNRSDSTPIKTVSGVSLGTWTGATRTATLTYTFDSTRAASTNALQAVRAGAWATTGGTYTVDVRVRDTSNPPAEALYTFEVGIDNYVPVADQVRTVTSTKVAGSNVQFQGRVFDYQGTPNNPQPEHKGIKEVRVWFTTRTTSTTLYINMATGARVNAAGAGAGTATTGIWTKPGATIAYNGDTVTGVTKTGNSTTASQNIPAATTTGGVEVSNNFVKVLNQGASGVTWSPTNNWDIYWSFDLNTTNFPDGWMRMHYVVYDHANNRSYYTQEMVVMNKSPKIANVTLYTNNTGEGAVFTTHEGNDAYSDYVIPDAPYPGGYLDSGFISKNMLIGFGVDTISGNPPLNYQVRYVERYRVPLTNANLRSMAKRANLSTRNPDGTITFNPNGTASATDYLRYYNDSNTLVTNVSVNDFINMYTIATGSGANLSAGVWQILGVPSATPADGSHFVFQGIEVTSTADPLYGVENNVVPMAFDDVFVYAYKEVKNKPAVSRTGNNANTIAPADMNFNGGDYFSTSDNNKINEARGTSTANATATNNAGTAYFLIKVWDTVDANETRDQTGFTEKDMLYDAIVIGMKVYLTDITNPRARLYDLNPYMETAVIGNNIGTTNQGLTRDEAAAPVEIGANIKRGGLYNLGTERAPIKSGYIDPRGASTALNPYVNYPSDPANPYAGSIREQPDGYVEDDALTGAAPDKVSGSILLRGLAWDDQLINTISLKIGSDAEKAILKLEYVNASGVIVPNPTDAQKLTLTRKMMPVGSQQAWSYEEISWKTGHTVEWAYLWNTEAEPATSSRNTTRGGPLTSVQIDVTVKDLNGNSKVGLNSAAVTTTAASPPTSFHNQVSVDIVPYITGFRRESPKFSTKRSRQGWYSFFQGEPNIRVLGYNMGTTITDDNNGTRIYLKSDAAAGEGTSLYNANTDIRRYETNTNMPNDGHIFAIPAAATSGRLNVTVRGTSAYNHTSSHVNRSWNTEYSAYTAGSDLWTNKPHAHIWRTNEDGTAPATYFGLSTDSTSMEGPSMALDYTATPGSLHGSWAIRSAFGVYYGVNNNSARTLLQAAQDPLVLTDIDYFPGATNANNRTVVAVYEWDGLPGVFLNTNMTTAGGGARRGDEIRPGLLVTGRSTDNVTSSDRWQNPRVRMASANVNTGGGTGDYNQAAARGNSGRLYASVYDSVNKSLYYITRNGAGTGTTDTGQYQSLLYIDGASSTGTFATGSVAAVARAGNWSAVDFTGGTGDAARPVVAYYDETNDTLRLAYGATNASTGAGSWTRRNVLATDHALFRGSGKYVSMKVDKNDFIHLAFFNSNRNTMVYAVGKRDGTFTAVAVDNVVTGGTWTDISVDNSSNANTPANPWIVYGDTGRTGSYDGVRIAYKDAAFTRTLTDPLSKNAITGWEALTMPANYTIADDRLNIESWPPTDRRATPATLPDASPNGGWHAAVGYGGTGGPNNSRMFRIGYFFKPPAAIMTGAGINWQEPNKQP